MAAVKFRGLCSGTQVKNKRDGSGTYTITRFVEVPSMRPFDVFGDLGLKPSEEVREYEFEATITGLSEVKLVNGANGNQVVKK